VRAASRKMPAAAAAAGHSAAQRAGERGRVCVCVCGRGVDERAPRQAVLELDARTPRDPVGCFAQDKRTAQRACVATAPIEWLPGGLWALMVGYPCARSRRLAKLQARLGRGSRQRGGKAERASKQASNKQAASSHPRATCKSSGHGRGDLVWLP
jgi:hypothetical protein